MKIQLFSLFDDVKFFKTVSSFSHLKLAEKKKLTGLLKIIKKKYENNCVYIYLGSG